MTLPATLLQALIAIAHNGNAAAFCRKHNVKPQSISSILNGKGNTGLSFRLLEKWANAEGYTVGMVLHPHTGDLAADALAHVRAAAVEARYTIEWQEDLTPEMREKLTLLCDLIERT